MPTRKSLAKYTVMLLPRYLRARSSNRSHSKNKRTPLRQSFRMWTTNASTTKLSPNMINDWFEPATIQDASSQMAARTNKPITAALTWRLPLTDPSVVSCICAPRIGARQLCVVRFTTATSVSEDSKGQRATIWPSFRKPGRGCKIPAAAQARNASVNEQRERLIAAGSFLEISLQTRDRIRLWGKRILFPGLDVHTRCRYRFLSRYFKGGAIDTLDAGCGNGALSYAAYRRGNRVLGVTMEPDQVQKDREYFSFLGTDPERLQFEVCNLYDLDRIERRFDQIICSETLEHITGDRAVVDSFYRLLREGGILHVCC